MSAHKIVVSIVLSAGLLMTAGSAFASDLPLGIDIDLGIGTGNGNGNGNGNGAAAPELAGHGAPAALALIAGGAAIVISRRRRQS